MNLPNDKEVIELIKVEAMMPLNIIKHSIVVNAISQFIAMKLIKKNININFKLVDYASILHDMFRYVDISNWYDSKFDEPISEEKIKKWSEIKAKFNGTHEEVAYEFLKEKYPELASVIKMHKFKKVLYLKTYEEKIVTYADKRSKHNEIVSLKERFRDGRIRNRHFIKKQNIKDEEISMIESKYFELEKELFSLINHDPNNLKKEIDMFINSQGYHNWKALLGV